MPNRPPFGIGEYYHCYNRGVDKRTIFESPADYNRFLALLYLANDISDTRLHEYNHERLHQILTRERAEPIVEIVAYCLMPNHFHLLLKEICDGGISHFMQKLGGYTMYFNTRHNRSGSLFQGTFKSKHLSTDEYLWRCITYIHLNPLDLQFPDWKELHDNLDQTQLRAMEEFLLQYRYASLPDLFKKRQERKLLAPELFALVADRPQTIPKMIATYQEP